MNENNQDDLDGKPVEDEILIDQDAGKDADAPVVEESPEELKAQLAEIRKNAETTQRQLDEERAQRAREKQSAAVELTDTRLQTISNAMDATAGQIKEAQAKRRAALEAGDWDAEATASDELMALKVKQSRLNEGKTAIEQQMEAAKAAPADPVDAYVSHLAPAAASWVRSHPEVVTDPRKNAKLTAAHWDAVGEGLAMNSPEYFAHIEERMGYGERQRQEEPRRDNPQAERRQAAPAAPPSRDVPNGNGQTRTTQIRLSAGEREAARMSGMTDIEYAKERDRLKATGAFLTTH
jgi:hypothetical protein